MVVARQTGSQPPVRQRALQHLWQQVEHEEKVTRKQRASWRVPARNEVVSIFLAEGDVDAAWDAFNGGAVTTALWQPMAEARAKTHPREAIALYHRLLPVVVEEGTRNARYESALEIVHAIQQLRLAQAEHAVFAGELADIKAAYRAKRNFMRLLGSLT